jgi:hypothetical protein
LADTAVCWTGALTTLRRGCPPSTVSATRPVASRAEIENGATPRAGRPGGHLGPLPLYRRQDGARMTRTTRTRPDTAARVVSPPRAVGPSREQHRGLHTPSTPRTERLVAAGALSARTASGGRNGSGGRTRDGLITSFESRHGNPVCAVDLGPSRPSASRLTGALGSLVTVRAGQVAKIAPNPAHPGSRGAFCVKGILSAPGWTEPPGPRPAPAPAVGGRWARGGRVAERSGGRAAAVAGRVRRGVDPGPRGQCSAGGAMPCAGSGRQFRIY